MPSKKRLAFVANTSWSIYRFRLSLIQSLTREGFAIHVFAPRDEYTSYIEQIPGVAFIALQQLNSKSLSLRDDLALYRELLHHYRQLKPDLIFHYTIKPNIYGSLAAARAGCRSIAVITGLGYTFAGPAILKAISIQLYRLAFKKNIQAWFLNNDDKAVFVEARIVSPAKTFVLPGEGIDPNRFYPAPYTETGAPTRFLLIARLIKHKGIAEFAEAAKMLRSKGLSLQCSLLGFADEKSAVAIPESQLQQWQQSGLINYLGATDDVVPYIAQSDCIVLPSYREGLPLSLLEAASMCKAVIASDTAGCRDVVQDNINGWLCKPKDAASLADKMEQYMALPPSGKMAMGNRGREMVLAHFTEDRITAIYLQQLKTLLP